MLQVTKNEFPTKTPFYFNWILKLFAVYTPLLHQNKGLHSQARLKGDETRRDWTSFPDLAVPGRDYFFLVSSVEKIQEKSGK